MPKENLKREIGVWGLSANIVNVVIGAGIFVLPAIVAAGLGSASIVAYLFCGFLITLIMLCFAEVGSKITTTGGAYTYIEKTFGKYPGFLTSILFLTASLTADAAVSNAIVDIISSVFPVFKVPAVKIIFLGILFSGLAYINIIGIKKGVFFIKMLTVLKIAPLLIIIMIGFKDISVNNLYWDAVPSIKQVGEMSLILFFAFQGAEVGLSVSGEVRNPQSTIPRAIRNSVLIVLAVYILVQTVSQGILGGSLATFLENPLAEVANQILGPIGFALITIGAAVSMFGNLSSEILSMPRVLFAAAEDKVFPIKKLASVHPKFATPYVAVITYASIGLLLASLGGFRKMAIVSSASSLLIYLGVSLATIKLRRSKNNNDGWFFRIRGGYTVPLFASVVIIWLLSNMAINEIWAMSIYLVILSVVYVLLNLRSIRLVLGPK